MRLPRLIRPRVVYPPAGGAAGLTSPAFNGVPTAPTAAPLDGSTQIATDAYADAAVLVEKTRAQAAETLLAPKASPTFTGTATAAAVATTFLTVTSTAAMDGLVICEGGTDTHFSAPALTPTFANGTAAQLSDLTRDYMIYFQIGTAGTAFVIAIGPTNTPANTIVTGAAATGGELYSFRLPASWYVKWSATTATLATQTAIGC
jgi:hypothetical protein